MTGECLKVEEVGVLLVVLGERAAVVRKNPDQKPKMQNLE